MKRPVPNDPLVVELVNFCLRGELPLDQRQAQLKALRLESTDLADFVDRSLLERLDQARGGLEQAQQSQAKLKEIVEKVLAPPWISAVFMGPIAYGAGARAIVHQGGARRVVELLPELKAELHPGDQVFLNHELNVITGVSPEGPPRCGEVGVFDRRTSDGQQLVVKWRDDELVIHASQLLENTSLQRGDLVRFDRAIWMAFEKVENVQGTEFLLEEVPNLTRDMLGGQDSNYEKLLSTLSAILLAPEKARRYHLKGGCILMVGPPGCGKTHSMRIVASEIARLSGRKARFGVVKPGAWESPYVGETQKAIRHTFQRLREAARDGLAFLFLDEIESISRTRGHFSNIHSDKHLAALLAELEGFEDRKDTTIIAATNRKDLIEPALLSRFNVEVQVQRPDQCAAKAILSIHLPQSLPFSPNGESAGYTRDEIIETAVSLLYAPNADNAICRLRFRDGKERTINARELMSGRFLMQVSESACRRAFARELHGVEAGVNVSDMEEAVNEGIDRLRTHLTPNNAHAHLADLPQDVDVVSVEPVMHKVPNARRYLNLAPI